MKIKSIVTGLLLAMILVSCAPAVTTVPATPISPVETLSSLAYGELSIHEFELEEPPDSESRTFKPVKGTASTILTEHQEERENFTSLPNAANYTTLKDGTQIYTTSWNGKQMIAEQNSRDAGELDTRTITVTLDKIEIFRLKIENPVMPSSSLQGLWTFENQWFVETTAKADAQHPYGIGEIFQTGQSLNKLYRYKETFGFQSLAGKPFYFFKQGGKVRISYDGQSLPVEYDHVPHYGCCSAGGINPIKSENMVSFFAKQGKKWYYIEIGIFKP